MYVWSLYADDHYAGYFIITTKKQVSIPDFPNGLDVLTPGELYYWRVETHGSPTTVDDMAGEFGYMGDFNRLAYLNPASPRSISSTYTATAQTWISTPE